MNDIREIAPIDLTTERWLTRAEVAGMIGVTPQALRDWERAGRGPRVVRFSPKVARYPAAQFQADEVSQ